MINLVQFDLLVGEDSYVLCRGKERIAKDIVDRDTAFKHLENRVNTIGWWVRTGYVVVDIDEGKEEAKEIVKALGIETLICETNKGLHLYFKTDQVMKQGVGMTLPCGLKCDTRVANKGYVLLPFNTEGRKFYGANEIAELPLEFAPIEWRKESLFNLAEGGGRNELAFKQLMAYKNKGATIDQIEIMGQIINRLVFKEPMGEKELRKILDNVHEYEAQDHNLYLFYNDKGKPSGVNEPAIRDYFEARDDLFVMGSYCFVYENGIYTEDNLGIMRQIENLISVPKFISNHKIESIFKLILKSKKLQRNPESLNPHHHLINFKNGVWNTETSELLPHDNKYLQTLQIPYEVERAKCKWEDTQIYKFLSGKCKLKQEDINMAADFMAYCLTLNRFKGFMVLHGPSNTGKSVLITFIERLVGSNNSVSLSMADLKERFRVANLYNVLLNTSADDSSKALTDTANIKKITGGDKITHEKKGKDPFYFTSFAKLIFSFNQLPLQIEDKSDAYFKRMRILHMETPLNLKQDYVDGLWSEYSVKQTIPHLLARLPLQDISSTPTSELLVEGLREDSDPIHAFVIQYCNEGANLRVDRRKLYTKYKLFCQNDLGVTPESNTEFYRHIKGRGFKERKTQGYINFLGIDIKR